MRSYHGIDDPYESGVKPIKNVLSKQVKKMGEETNVHKLLKVVFINSMIDQLNRTAKKLVNEKKRILEKGNSSYFSRISELTSLFSHRDRSQVGPKVLASSPIRGFC